MTVFEVFLWRNGFGNKMTLLRLKFSETFEIARWNKKLKSGYHNVLRIFDTNMKWLKKFN